MYSNYGRENPMAFIVKQGGSNKQVAIYLAESVYDSKKRGARQRREYLGVFDEPNSELLLERTARNLTR